MSFDRYYLLGQFVESLLSTIFKYMAEADSNAKLCEAEQLLNKITSGINEKKDNFDDYFALYKRASQCVCTHVGMVQYDDTEESEDTDDTVSEDTDDTVSAVSYTHLTLPTNREV